VSTEGILLVWLIKYVEVYYYHKKGAYPRVIRFTARRYVRGRQHGPHEGNLLKTLEITEIQRKEFLNYMKEL